MRTEAPDADGLRDRAERQEVLLNLPKRADSLDVQQLWLTLRQHYKLVALIGLCVFALVMGVTLASRMQFRAVARLYLGELEAPGGSANQNKEQLELSAGSQGVVGSEIEIIQSRSLVSRAVLDSGLNVGISAWGRTPPRYGQWLLSRRDPVLIDAVSDELFAQDSLLTDERALERAYRLRFTSETDYEVWDDEHKLGQGRLGELVKVPGANLHLLRGTQRGPRAGAQYSVVVRPLLEVIDAALKALQVTSPKPTPQSPPVNVVTLEFSSASPRQAAKFLDRLIAAYLAERQSWKVEDAGAAEAFVAQQLSTIRSSLDDIQMKLANYRTANRVVVMDNEAKAMIEQIGKYEEQRVAARLEAAALAEVQRTLRGPNPPVGAFLLGEANDKVLEGMAAALSTARQKLTDLDSRFNEAAPEVRDQRGQVEAQLDSIRNYVSSRAARAQENLGTLDGIIAQYEKRLQTVPGAELGLAQLSRESDVYSRTYSYLLERQQQTAIIKASTLSKNRVLDAPQMPHREDSPRLLLRLASAPLGLLLGMLVVLGRSFFASTFQSEQDVRAVTGGLPVMASVPRRPRLRGERAGVGRPDSFDVLGADRTSSFIEAFRALRARLYRSLGTDGRVVLLTSPSSGDGKTTCCLALAGILAADGKRVLVIDADLRKPNAGSSSEIDGAAPGLPDVLRGEQEWAAVVRPISAEMGQFYALLTDGLAATELLTGRRMAELVSDARQRCDVVLIDGASFPATSDALVLSELCDFVLSVIRVGNTPRKAALEHVRGLSLFARGHGVVLNDVGEAVVRHSSAVRSRRRGLAPAAHEEASQRLTRGRAWAWWMAGLLLLATAAAAAMSPKTAAVISSVVSFRHAS